MNRHKKRDTQLQRLYQYFAEHGFKQVDNISYITKGIGISRSLFYFYFKDIDDLFAKLADYHLKRVAEEHKLMIEHGITHLQYLQKLVEHKDLYFFAIQCRRYRQEHPKLDEMYRYVLDTVDQENFKLFITHYQLESFSERSIKLLYDSFRGFWYDNSEYHNWNADRAGELALQVNEMMLLLKSRHSPE